MSIILGSFDLCYKLLLSVDSSLITKVVKINISSASFYGLI